VGSASPTTLHRHGDRVHGHPYSGPHRHLSTLLRLSEPLADAPSHDYGPDHEHPHHHHSHLEHEHSHGLVDKSIVRSREGVKAVSISLAVLLAAALAQTAIFVASGSVALLADLIHNFGDALTAVPLGIAFFLRSYRGEKLAGWRSSPRSSSAPSLPCTRRCNA
jgi:hypothetical protein